MERTLYGEASVQLAKTYKVIGTLYIIASNPVEAREYLMRAHGIFEAKGLLKLLKEVKSKLKMLNSSVKLAAEMAAAEGIESGGDESGKEGSPKREGSANAKRNVQFASGNKGAKVIGKKIAKKTVFRNNFVKESESNPQLKQ